MEKHEKVEEEAMQRVQELEEQGVLPGGVHDAPENAENDLAVQELARFAVDQYNKKANSALEFVKIVKVRQQVVAGFIYYFTIEAKDGGEKKLYEAKVYERAWEHFKELEDFKPLGDGHVTAA